MAYADGQLEDLAENSPDRVKILKKANVKKVIKDGEKVIGVDYEYQGKHVSSIDWYLYSELTTAVHRDGCRHSRHRGIRCRLYPRLPAQEASTRILRSREHS
jgi:hypothetical protein